ncbi:MAG: TerC family protein [Planctomycetes bacterium]|nr:TerC family protein [Planctomycetota bacterium]
MTAGLLLSTTLASANQFAQPVLFPIGPWWPFYAGFTLFVLAVLALDLGVFHRQAHEVSFREAATWSAVWAALAILFGAGFWWWLDGRLPQLGAEALQAAGYGADARAAANRLALEYFAGYVIEQSLSVDNVFVFVVILRYFAVPAKYQHRVLFYGILGAVVCRAIFIALGSLLLKYAAVVWIFGIFLGLTGVKMLFPHEKAKDLSRNPVLRVLRRFMPVTPDFHGQRFLVRLGGVRHATPLMVALLVVEFTDIIFAVDSVPAIYAVTREPLVVFTSNIFAILGLRALYFLLAGAMDRFHLLHFGLGLVLMFVGVKMLLPIWGTHVPIGISLSVICGVIGASVAFSLLFPKRAAAGTPS